MSDGNDRPSLLGRVQEPSLRGEVLLHEELHRGHGLRLEVRTDDLQGGKLREVTRRQRASRIGSGFDLPENFSRARALRNRSLVRTA